MRRLILSDMDHGRILSRLIAEKAAQMDAARQADKQGPGLGDGWRAQAQETYELIVLLNSAETF